MLTDQLRAVIHNSGSTLISNFTVRNEPKTNRNRVCLAITHQPTGKLMIESAAGLGYKEAGLAPKQNLRVYTAS